MYGIRGKSALSQCIHQPDVSLINAPLRISTSPSKNTAPGTSSSGSPSSGNTSSGKSNSSSTPKATRIASTEGAFNGTGFATLTENISTEPLLHLFYQNFTGQVQHAVRAPGGTWSGGDSSITTDARGATPLAAVNYTSNGNLTVRISSTLVLVLIITVNHDNYRRICFTLTRRICCKRRLVRTI